MLAGGGEFQGAMEAVDRRALQLAGGPAALVGIVPAAAFPDGNHLRAGARGRRWFRSLGASQVRIVGLCDRRSAEDERVLRELEAARLIYLLGGFPHHLGRSLKGTAAGRLMASLAETGVVVAGSSAGAMVLGDWYFDPPAGTVHQGLGLVPGVCVIPHFNVWGASWVPRLRARLPEVCLLGIDEGTGLIREAPGDPWRVYGGGRVTCSTPRGDWTTSSGAALALAAEKA